MNSEFLNQADPRIKEIHDLCGADEKLVFLALLGDTQTCEISRSYYGRKSTIADMLVNLMTSNEDFKTVVLSAARFYLEHESELKNEASHEH